MIIDGKKIASDIVTELKTRPKSQKFLAVFLVGEDPSSVSFIRQKEKIAQEIGIDFRLYKFPENIRQDDLRKEVFKIVEHKTCGGVVVQLPLPNNINKHYILNVIPREKDIDVLGERALGAFYAGRNHVLPPAVGVIEKILGLQSFVFENKKIAVIGLGMLVGKPAANWLMSQAKEVFLLENGSDFSVLKETDLVISGVGKAHLFSAKNLKENALVIDFGYDQKDEKIAGDFDPAVAGPELTFTPTPGGTGPILVAQVFANFYKLSEIKSK